MSTINTRSEFEFINTFLSVSPLEYTSCEQFACLAWTATRDLNPKSLDQFEAESVELPDLQGVEVLDDLRAHAALEFAIDTGLPGLPVRAPFEYRGTPLIPSEVAVVVGNKIRLLPRFVSSLSRYPVRVSLGHHDRLSGVGPGVSWVRLFDSKWRDYLRACYSPRLQFYDLMRVVKHHHAWIASVGRLLFTVDAGAHVYHFEPDPVYGFTPADLVRAMNADVNNLMESGVARFYALRRHASD
jgi:hypothetical protein